MVSDSRHDDVRALAGALVGGRLGRREFIRRAAALGLSASAIAAALAACGASPTPTSAPAATSAPTAGATTAAATAAPTAVATAAAAASPTTANAGAASPAAAPSATPAPTATAAPAAAGPTKRGGGGTLKLLQWQAMTTLNPHFSSGTKDDIVCRIVYEPLATIDKEGKFVPVLADAIPSAANGQLAADGKSVTWKLKSGLTWSDGQPVTADDVVFTYQYVTDPKTAATSIAAYAEVTAVEKVDDLTLKATFKGVTPGWYTPFFGVSGCILPKHVFEADKGEAARNSQNNLKPVGTGPYKVTEFKPGDSVVYAINEHYREANKPSFDRIQVKGGGDAVSAARAVLQTGDYDLAPDLQVEDNILKQLEAAGKGVAVFNLGSGVERLFLNFTDPNKEDPATGERSSLKFPHPFLTDKSVRRALTLGCDRATIVQALYGRIGVIGDNLLYNPPQFNSPNNKSAFDLAQANALLDQAGWQRGADGYRAKGGVKLALVYQTTVDSLRQKVQQVVKDGWEKLGFKVELKSVDSGVFFSSAAGNPDTAGHFYADVEEYRQSNTSPDPQSYMQIGVSTAAAQKANNWAGANRSRYQNPDYDALWDQARTELDPEKRAGLYIKMNDILVQDVVHIPLVYTKNLYVRKKNLLNTDYTPWDAFYYVNIADWVRQS
ncbi:MAG TPA: peptide ABC transporter substrate-binding protein [Thermomicrobiales bacterium]|nr:peptide ABC transporter substrate-binding protein [Thermomicrobiales bacterium]